MIVGEGKQKWCKQKQIFVDEQRVCKKCNYYIISNSFEPNECIYNNPKEGNRIF